MSIREVNAVAITDAVEELCIRANTQLPPDVKQALDNAHAAEPWPLARQTLELLQQNLCVAAEKDLPIRIQKQSRILLQTKHHLHFHFAFMHRSSVRKIRWR